MILPNGDKRREDFLKQGNLLWRLRNTGGGGNGLTAGGMVLLIFAALIAIPLIAADFAKGGIFFGCLLGVPGAILFLWGILFHKKRMKNYLSYYQEETGFDLEELERLEKELMDPDMFMIGNVPEYKGGYSEKKPQIVCMMTKHYFLMPMPMGKSYIRRISDMILAAYTEEIPGMGGYRRGLVFLSTQDDVAYSNSLDRNVCEELIQELCRRNPEVVAERFFSDGDRQYDVISDGAEIVRLHKERMEKATKQEQNRKNEAL